MFGRKQLTAIGTAVCLLALTGCESKVKPSPTTSGKKQETVLLTPTATPTPEIAGEEARDLNDLRVTIADWRADADTPGSTYDEAYRDEQDGYMQKHRYTLERVKDGDYRESWSQEVIESAQAGTPKGSIVAVDPKWIPKLLEAEAIIDISKYETVEWNDAKYNQGVLNSLSFGGNIYGFTDEVHPCGGVFINKTLLEDAGIGTDTIHNLQKTGQWDFQNFRELCEKLTSDSDGDGTTDRYAVTGSAQDFLRSLIIANHSDLVTLENGALKLNTDDKKLLTALHFGSEIMRLGYYENQSGADARKAFAEGKAAMLFTMDDTLETFQSLKEENPSGEFLYAAVPMGPDAENYITVCRENVYVLLNCDEIRNHADDILYAYSLYAQPATTMNGVDRIAKFKKQNADLLAECEDYGSYQTVLDMAGEYETYMPVSEIWLAGMKTEALGEIAGGKTPEEVLEACAAGWQSLVDSCNAKLR